MKFLLCAMALLALSACSFRGWDPPNYNQSLCAPSGISNNGSSSMPHIPLVQMNNARL